MSLRVPFGGATPPLLEIGGSVYYLRSVTFSLTPDKGVFAVEVCAVDPGPIESAALEAAIEYAQPIRLVLHRNALEFELVNYSLGGVRREEGAVCYTLFGGGHGLNGL